jgi:uncharacterized membrane protein
VSKGKLDVVRTLSGNERAVVELLMKEGGLRRNVLERESKLAKSSLASTLAQLEKRNIVSVDKGSTVHFVKLTDWFESL